MTEQLGLDALHVCDVCVNGTETDPATGLPRPCRVCGGTGFLDYAPPAGDDPFEGMAAA